MAQLQAQLKRGILDELWNAVPVKADEGALEAAIRGFKSARFEAIQTGTYIVNTSGGGYSVSFAAPELFRQLGPDQFFMLGMEFLDILTDAITTLAANNITATNEALFACMMADDRLTGSRIQMGDFSLQRWPSISSRG